MEGCNQHCRRRHGYLVHSRLVSLSPTNDPRDRSHIQNRPSQTSPLPIPLPLEDFVGDYSHPGHGPISTSLQCSGWKDPADSLASPTITKDGCRMVAIKTSNLFRLADVVPVAAQVRRFLDRLVLQRRLCEREASPQRVLSVAVPSW